MESVRSVFYPLVLFPDLANCWPRFLFENLFLTSISAPHLIVIIFLVTVAYECIYEDY